MLGTLSLFSPVCVFGIQIFNRFNGFSVSSFGKNFLFEKSIRSICQ
jgi:hypothetical protein